MAKLTKATSPMEGGYIIYTDGSFRRPIHGAWGYLLHDSSDKELHREAVPVWNTTINRMELLAMINGLEKVLEITKTEIPKVAIYSDSQYSIKAVLWWIPVWARNGWKNQLGEDVKNRDLMERLFALRKKIKISAWHVKAHSGHKYNERVDEMVQDLTKQMAAGTLKPSDSDGKTLRE